MTSKNAEIGDIRGSARTEVRGSPAHEKPGGLLKAARREYALEVVVAAYLGAATTAEGRSHAAQTQKG